MPIYTIKTPSGYQLDIRADDEDEAMRGAEEWHAERTGLRGLARPITNLIPTQRQLAKESLDQVARGVTQLSGEGEGGDTTWEGIKGLGNVALGSLGYVTSPIGAGLRTFIGEPIEEATGGRVPKEYTEFTAGLAMPGIGLPRLPRPGAPAAATPRVPGFNVSQGAPTLPPPLPTRSMGVTLSEGQRTRDLPQIQFETSAARGQLGPAAEQNAAAFIRQQQAELAAARGNIAETLDPVTGMRLDAQEAATLAQRGVQERAAQAKRGVTAAYDTAKQLPGEIHAGAFEGMPQRIKGDLTLGDSPTIIDPMLTPYANAMIKDLEANVGRIKIPNAADPFGAPSAERITGVGLKGVDQWRKRLSKLRGDAFASGNNADANAARAVLDAFDNQIDNAVNGGLFTGDPRAVNAWNAARASHSDYRATFTRQGGQDRVGKVIEKIIGRGDRDPAAIPNDVADFIYGAAGTNPNSLNVAVVNRLRSILGETSPEWAAVKQGLFSRLAEAGQGMTQWGPARVAQNINRFLNNDGREMAARMFSPAERSIMQQYADVLRHLEIPQAGANWSNTATFAGQGFRESSGMKIAEELTGFLTNLLGGWVAHAPIIGKPIRSGIETAIEKVAGVPGQAQDARRVAAQMPVIANVVRQHARAQKVWSVSPNARNAARVALTERNLAEQLDKLGIQFGGGGAAAPLEITVGGTPE